MINMAKKDIFPAVSKFTGELAQNIINKKAVSALIKTDAEEKLLTELSELLSKFAVLTDELDEKLSLANKYKSNPLTLAEYYRDYVLTAMEKLRVIGDKMETDMSTEHWPYPSYGDMLYSIQ